MPSPLPFLVSESLKKHGFVHAFSTRRGGVSEEPFDSLDFSLLRDAACLKENLRRFAAAVGFSPARVFQAHQVHGRAVCLSGGDPAESLAEEADALVAGPGPGPGDAVAVRVADCVPVLIADSVSGRVAAVHAGWRGITADVVGAAIAHFEDTEPLIAAIGPSIGACCFEVDVSVAKAIADATSASVVVASDEVRGKARVDLRRAVRAQLRFRGLRDAEIDDVPGRSPEGCTRCNAGSFYSYRRDGEASGRLLAVIVARATSRLARQTDSAGERP